MADEKEQTKEQDDKPKKGLPPLVLVALGAMLGGGGMVFMSGGSEAAHVEPPVVIKLYDHPDVMSFTFNPKTKRGHKTAMVSFRFSYKADERLMKLDPNEASSAKAGGHGGGGGGGKETVKLGKVPKAIKRHWHYAYSRCLSVLMRQSVETLNSDDGREHLRRLLVDELQATLFPKSQATVDDILWTKFYVQA